MPLPWHQLLRLPPIVLVVGLIVFLVWRAMPPAAVTIEAGPGGGSYYQIAEKHRDALRTSGVNLSIASNPIRSTSSMTSTVRTPSST